MKMASRSTELISKKQIAHDALFFFWLAKKKKNKFARAAHFLSFFAVALHNYNDVLED